jgi:hypothetical protein
MRDHNAFSAEVQRPPGFITVRRSDADQRRDAACPSGAHMRGNVLPRQARVLAVDDHEIEARARRDVGVCRIAAEDKGAPKWNVSGETTL